MFFLWFSPTFPAKYEAIGNPAIYPKVGEEIIPKPPFPPEKTGKPINPIKIYKIWDMKPSLLPKIRPDKITKKTCKVIGIPITGIIRMLLAQVKAVINDILVNLLVFSINLIKSKHYAPG